LYYSLQPTEWQRIGNQIGAAFIFAGAGFVKVLNRFHREDHQQHAPPFSRDRQRTSAPSSTRVPQRQLLKMCASLGLIQSHCTVRRKACKVR